MIISISGSLDTLTAEEATAYLIEKIDAGNTSVILNLEALEYISSAGVRVILGAIKEARSNGGDLRLVQMTSQVLDTLEMAGITSVVKYYDEIESALDSFAD